MPKPTDPRMPRTVHSAARPQSARRPSAAGTRHPAPEPGPPTPDTQDPRPASPRICPVTPADVDAVLALLERCDLPRAGLAAHFARALVARADDAVVGCVALEVYGRAALLRSLAVEPEWRSRGLGRALVEAVLAAARAVGVTRVYLLTDTAEAFFARFGFRRVARDAVDPAVLVSEEFTHACPATTPVMWKDLGA